MKDNIEWRRIAEYCPNVPSRTVSIARDPDDLNVYHDDDDSVCTGLEGRIVSIETANAGWRAAFRDTDAKPLPHVYEAPLVAWALVEHCDGTRQVRGLDAYSDHGVVQSECKTGFQFYLAPGDTRSDVEKNG